MKREETEHRAPRTQAERLAFISGYAQAVIDIHTHDLSFAQRLLLKMVGLEVEPPPRRRGGREHDKT